MCLYAHPFFGVISMPMLGVVRIMPRIRDVIYNHIGVGFDVARSTNPGNAKASIRGTGNRAVPRHFFVCECYPVLYVSAPLRV